MKGAAATRASPVGTTDAARFSRRGACPALSAPMQTGDGLLVRLNPFASSLSPWQLTGLCAAAERHGNGIVEVTARGSFQIRGLNEASAAALAREVDALGIAVRTGVPVQTAALAGLDPAEIADPRLLADRIRSGIESAGLGGKLGAKVSVVVDGGGHSGLDEVAADVRLVAIDPSVTGTGSGPHWTVSIAGDAKTATPVGNFAEDAATDVMLQILWAIATLGQDARARDLLTGGTSPTVQWLESPCSTLPPSGLPAISPTRGEIGSGNVGGWLISPRVGEMAGRPEGGAKERSLAETASSGLTGATAALLLRDGRFALSIALPFGQAEARELARLAASAETLGIDEIRLAPGRTIIALCPSHQTAGDLRNTAMTLGFVTDPADPRRSISACPGSPACASGKMAARQMASAIARQTAGLLDGSISLHVSGCAKGCAHPGTAALTLVGTESGVGLVANGTARDKPLAYEPDDKAAMALSRVAALVASERRTRETSAECLTRLGAARLAAAFSDGE